MLNVLIVGATRGLGASLTKCYASHPDTQVYGTMRSSDMSSLPTSEAHWIPGVDIGTPSAGSTLVSGLQSHNVASLHIVVITAGYFGTESFETPDWDAQLKMYSISSMGPVFVMSALAKAGLLAGGAKVILVSSESGSITLRHESEGGGNYGHHASKAALNMVGKLLSLDLKDKGVAVGIVHPGFMRTEMTKGVGFDKFWDKGGAVLPDEAATSLVDFIETFDISKTGQYWAPRGPGDIGTIEDVIGPKSDLPTPLQLPW